MDEKGIRLIRLEQEARALWRALIEKKKEAPSDRLTKMEDKAADRAFRRGRALYAYWGDMGYDGLFTV